MLTIGSLFSGIGGLELGLERAGMKTIWQCEKDDYARRVLAKNFPGVECHGDIRELRNPVRVDVLCGGFPCQDISVAGKGAGIKEGTRSGLWLEYARLIRELRPHYVLVENVPALRKRGLGRVLGDLASSGYDAEWDCLPASAFGANHQRDRLFVIAYARDSGLAGQREVPGVFSSEKPRVGSPSRFPASPREYRADDGVRNRVDRLKCLGNAVVPAVSEFIGRLIVAHSQINADALAIRK